MKLKLAVVIIVDEQHQFIMVYFGNNIYGVVTSELVLSSFY